MHSSVCIRHKAIMSVCACVGVDVHVDVHVPDSQLVVVARCGLVMFAAPTLW